MKKTGWVLIAGLLTMLSGCGESNSRYFSKAEHERNVANQVAMTPQTLAVLRTHGVEADTMLRLEFFFYTDTKAKAARLTSALKDLGYDAGHDNAAIAHGTFVVTGWTTEIQMDTPVVLNWARDMCELGYEHDAEFDGWGTTPEQ